MLAKLSKYFLRRNAGQLFLCNSLEMLANFVPVSPGTKCRPTFVKLCLILQISFLGSSCYVLASSCLLCCTFLDKNGRPAPASWSIKTIFCYPNDFCCNIRISDECFKFSCQHLQVADKKVIFLMKH